MQSQCSNNSNNNNRDSKHHSRHHNNNSNSRWQFMLCYVIISYTTRHLHPCISEHKYSGWFRTSGESIFVDIWNDICRARLLRQDEGNTEIRKTLLLVNDTYFDIKAIFSQDLSQPSYYKLIAWCFLYNIIVGVYVQCIQHSAAQKMKRKFNKNAWRCFL